MSRKDTSEELSHLLDGRLSAKSARLLRTRIEEDPELYERYSALKSARDVVRADSGIKQLPQGFDARLRKRLHSEELRDRAEARAVSETTNKSHLQRLTFALGGMAAGVALAMALGPLFGYSFFKSAPETPTPVIAEAPAAAPISIEYLEPVVAKKVAALADLERQTLGLGSTVDAAWLEGEIALAGLDEDLSELEAMLSASPERDALLLLGQLREIDETISTLKALTREGLRMNRPIETDQVNSLLQQAQTLRFQDSQALNQLANQAKVPTQNVALSAFMSARASYHDGRYELARQGFESFRRDWPESSYSSINLLWLARASARSGKGSDALQLLEAATESDPALLAMLSNEDFDRLADSCGILAPDLVDASGGHGFTTPEKRVVNYRRADARVFLRLKNRWLRAGHSTR